MITIPFMECCTSLAIDPKTLRQWLKQAMMPLSTHPTDARVKCLTRAQVQQLALLHGRLLKPDDARQPSEMMEVCPQKAQLEPPHPQWIANGTLAAAPAALLLEKEDLSQKLSHLEVLVEAQQQQLALLSRELRSERRLSLGAQRPHPTAEPDLSRSRHENQTLGVPRVPKGPRSLHPAEQRARLLVLPPLIEYGAAGAYVVISSQEGEIPLIPDSPQWFEWFQTLSSFRFVGKAGYFGVARGYSGRPLRTWYAYRTIHQHAYKHYLGLSERLTVAHLEAMAAQFQSYVDAL